MKRGARNSLLGPATIALGFFPSVVNAVDDREIGAEGENKQRNRKSGGKPVQQRSDNQQPEALRALPEADATTVDERLSARLGVTDHDGAGHHKAGEQGVKETIHGRVIDKKAKENGQVRITMEDGFQKRMEKINARLSMGKRPGYQVACGGRHHRNAGGEEAPGAEENSGDDAETKAGKGENTGGDAGSRKARNGSLEHPTKGPAENLDANRHEKASNRR